MPISGGKYVNPGWSNGTSPAINASELNDMSNTLALVPIANGGTGMTGIVESTEGDPWTFRKWGKIVFASYVSSSKENNTSGSAGSIPADYRPAGNVHFTVCGFSSSSTITDEPLAYGKVQIRTNGQFAMSLASSNNYYVRGSACWLTA